MNVNTEFTQDEGGVPETVRTIVWTVAGEQWVNVAALRETLEKRKERALRGIDRHVDDATKKDRMLADIYTGRQTAFNDLLDWLREIGAG